MRVLVQWARSRADDWEEVSSVSWASTPARLAPKETRRLGAEKGWVNSLNINGNLFNADRYYVEDLSGGGLRVTCVNDDERDWPGRLKHARVVEIFPHVKDPRFGGAYNTCQRQTIYTDDPVMGTVKGTGLDVRPWSEFRRPHEDLARYGVWTDDELYEANLQAKSHCGWREWTEGVTPNAVSSDGKVKQQRRRGYYDVPKGTRTYYLDSTNLLIATHVGANQPQFENAFLLAPTGATLQTATGIAGNGSVCWSGVTPVNEPDQVSWPIGNYRLQLDVNNANADLLYGVTTLGSSARPGHFARVNAAINAEVDTHLMQESPHSLSGLKMCSTGSVSWTGATQTDRFEVTVTAYRAFGHGNADMTLEVGESDDFTDGPWPAAAVGATEDSLFLGPGIS